MPKTLIGIKLRLYPNAMQRAQLAQMFGNNRFVHNQLLNMQNQRYHNNPSAPYINGYGMNYLITQLKREYPFLKESDSSSLQVAAQTLDQTFQGLFNHRNGHPKFKSRHNYKQSYSGKSKPKVIKKRRMKLPKLGEIKTSKTGQLTRFDDYKIKRYTVTFDSDNRYYLSLIVKVEIKPLPKTNKVVGIDLGLSNLIVQSDGTEPVEPFVHNKLDQKIKQAQRKFDRRKNQAIVAARQFNHNHPELPAMDKTDYQNWQKARVYKACLQRHLANMRNDYLQKATTKLVQNYDVIVMEDLKVKNLLHNHNLAKGISNAAWRKIRDMLVYKCRWYGKRLIIVNPRNTSRICHNCGRLQEQFKRLSEHEWLDTRDWDCEQCGAHQDRDKNAAINILNRAQLA